jgi:hypothetical protein
MAVTRVAGGPGGRGSARFTWQGATVQRVWEAQIQAGLEAEAAEIRADLQASIHIQSGEMRRQSFAEVAVRGTKRTIVAGSGVSYAIYEEARHPQIRMVIDRHAPHVTQKIAAQRRSG